MSKWLLLVGIVCGIAAAVMVNLHLGSLEAQQQGLAFVRLASDVQLAAGEAITRKEQLRQERLPKSFESLTEVAIPWTQDSLLWLKDRRVTRSVGAGEFLTYAHFSTDQQDSFAGAIAPGFRALSLPVSGVTAVSYFVEPGSRVDVLATLEFEQPLGVGGAAGETAGGPLDDGAPPAPVLTLPSVERRVVTRTVLQNIKVLAVGAANGHQDYLAARDEGYATVTVELSPADAETLVAVLQQARSELTLALRAPGDDAVVETPDIELGRE